MAGVVGLGVLRLNELPEGQSADCFALLTSKQRGTTKRNDPFVKCFFRDRTATREAPIWANDPLLAEADGWAEGLAYRVTVLAEKSERYGWQLRILGIRPADDDLDGPDGYCFADLIDSTRFPIPELYGKVFGLIDRYIRQPHLNRLVKDLLDEHGELFRKMPAAQSMHHSYTAGLLEHVWSMSRLGAFVADHYAQYYAALNPPLDTGIIVAATILHDIGKIRELEYHPVEARYTKVGCLVGHVLMGRDMIREAAHKIDGFPEETLLLLEHAVLAHHGKREFGAPILPQTIEALIVAFIDDLDAKVNASAKERMKPGTEGEFTDRVYALDNRRMYKGIPVELPSNDFDTP